MKCDVNKIRSKQIVRKCDFKIVGGSFAKDI